MEPNNPLSEVALIQMLRKAVKIMRYAGLMEVGLLTVDAQRFESEVNALVVEHNTNGMCLCGRGESCERCTGVTPAT
jgi:hypothetical protein